MMVHPLIMAVLACDTAAVALLVMGAVTSARVVSGWQPGAPTRDQLGLERRSEAASMQGRWALGIFGVGSLILIVAVSGVLPAIVPGAMCGTGVTQATGGLADRALALRLLAIALLCAWRLHDRLDRSAPTAPLTVQTAKLLLLAAPVAVVAALDTVSALASLDVHTPVDCCSVVFDQVTSTSEATATLGVSDGLLTRLVIGLGVMLMGTASWLTITRRGHRAASALLASIALIWTPLAAVALVRIFSAYQYGVLHHHCPWCLFLTGHRLVGYPLFGALLVIFLDGFAVFLATRIARAHPDLMSNSLSRARIGAVRVLIAVVVFGLIVGAPAAAWRLKYGVWMTG